MLYVLKCWHFLCRAELPNNDVDFGEEPRRLSGTMMGDQQRSRPDIVPLHMVMIMNTS
jgi:hypothetical protein